MLICWVGAAVSTQESDLALDYGMRLHEALTVIDKRSAESLILKVESGEEISYFTDFFLDWDKTEVDEIDIQTEEISQILQEMKVSYEASQAPAEDKSSPAEEAEAAKAAKVNISEEMTTLEEVKKPVQAAAVPVKKFPKVMTLPDKKNLSKWGNFNQDFSFADRFPVVDPSKKYDYKMLKADYESLKNSDIVINPLKKEEYLDEKIFSELFGCSKDEYDKLPQWKKNEKKKKVGLF
jgi:hypothetical protein